jgi:hypothetical protein
VFFLCKQFLDTENSTGQKPLTGGEKQKTTELQFHQCKTTYKSLLYNEPPAKARIVIESVTSAEKAAVAKC